ncbi:ABC transporter substrate-binding protein [Biostraticola tofi]|uniref:Peptide/nickel transport system substrate-binding protein n=1 Tax=Biostraticola tofi TaxID=466109 RepID=A0A4R3YQG9_9GAMM|nr:ABC transporter substrate-binding protein [Biostraticola tofi]TCV95165.1 peptide/nickel transport system substrate-binding protein [Biostraticola tofi]
MQYLLPSVLATALAMSYSAEAATPADTLVIAQSIDDASSFDPAEGFELTTVQSFNSLYQRLIQSDPHNPIALKPTLAESWTAGDDNRSLTFTLRPNSQFSSGNPLRPEDVIFSLSRVVKLNLEPSFILTQLGWDANNVDSMLQKTADNQVKISWTANVSPTYVLSLLSAPVSSIVDAKQALSHQKDNDFGHAWLGQHSAGSGPYKIRTYVPHEVLVLQANASSPEGAPKLANILIKNVPDPAARRLLVEQGDADMARNLGADQMAALKDKPGVKPLAIPMASVYFLQFNTEASPLLKNPAFWEASRYLFDYHGIADDLLKGQFQVHQAFLPEGYLGALKDKPYQYDPEKAKAILAKAGITHASFKISVTNQPPYLDIAQALQGSFARGGVKVEVVPGISAQVSNNIKSHNYQASLSSWGPDYFDPNTNAAAFAYNPEDGSKTLAWRANWHIPALSQKTLDATAESDQQKRVALYEEMQKEVQQSSPFVIGLQARNLIAVRDNLKGYVQGINPDMVFYSKVSK